MKIKVGMGQVLVDHVDLMINHGDYKDVANAKRVWKRK